VPNPANPQYFNRYSYVVNRPLKYVDPSGHCGHLAGGGGSVAVMLKECIDTIPGGSKTVAGVAAVGIATKIVATRTNEGVRDIPDVLPRPQRKPTPTPAPPWPDDDNSRRAIVELGSGDFSNLVRIASEYAGDRVIGIEGSPDQQLFAEKPATQTYVNYTAALALGAEVYFQDFSNGLPNGIKADEIIAIAPNPFNVDDFVGATRDIKSGGRIYMAAAEKATAQNLAQQLSNLHGVSVPVTHGQSRYPSQYFGKYSPYDAWIVDFVAP
jgi:hypothetical protein